MSRLPRIVSSYSEWQPLEEVIVGTMWKHRVPIDELSARIFYWENYLRHEGVLPADLIPTDRVFAECAEDLDDFAEALVGEGVTVRRPDIPSGGERDFWSPYEWGGRFLPAYNVRDQILIYGDTVIETPPLVRTRAFENDLLKSILYKYFAAGAKWIVAPRPTMTDASFDTAHISPDATWLLPDRCDPLVSPRFEMMFDAAQCLRFGTHIIANVSNDNHKLGIDWLQRILPAVTILRVSLCDSHLDATIVPLRPGLLMVDSRLVPTIDMLPAPLRGWDIIWICGDDLPQANSDTTLKLASNALSMNILSLDEKRVMVDGAATAIMRKLQTCGIDPIPVRFRHGRVFGGGLHCVTLDVRRRGDPEAVLEH